MQAGHLGTQGVSANAMPAYLTRRQRWFWWVLGSLRGLTAACGCVGWAGTLQAYCVRNAEGRHDV